MAAVGSRFSQLFRPIRINNTILKNRIIAAPATNMIDKAVGGAGLVIVGSGPVDKEHAPLVNEPYPFDKYQLWRTADMAKMMRRGGAAASFELIHAGRYASHIGTNHAWSSVSLVRDDGMIVDAMDEAMMEEVARNYARAALDAKSLGFDMVFLHFAHGWLPSQFLSPYFNQRTDGYGGSFENRAKFPLKIVQYVRAAVGRDYPVDMRIGAYEWVDGSIAFDDVMRFIKLVEPYIDMIHVSSGLDIEHSANVHMATTIFEPHMTNVEWASEVRKQVHIPVAVVGSIMTPEEAEGILEEGKADLVAFGRSLIADPFWPKKVLEGREDDVVPCIRCLQCYHIATARRNVGCSVNPRFFNEDLIPVTVNKAENPKNVLVVGGGPAGMKAALTAEQRGHHVTLLEKKSELGGALVHTRYEATKGDLQRYLDYLTRQIGKSSVDVRLGLPATPAVIRALDPDSMILAIGAMPTVPSIKGLETMRVLQAIDAYPVLDTLGHVVVVIGGGMVGAELGLSLSERGHNVTIVEPTGTLAGQGNMLYREGLRQHVAASRNLTCLLNTTCVEVQPGRAIVENPRSGRVGLPADVIILATGMRPDEQALQELLDIVPDTYVIGDCRRPRSVQEATREGYDIAANL